MVACAAWCAVAFAALIGLAYFVEPTRWLDTAALNGFAAIDRPRLHDAGQTIAHLCNPVPYAIAAALVVAIAAIARGPRTGAAVGLLLVGANASSQLLKPALAYHRELYHTHWHLFNLQDAAFPSGHATAAMSISLAALMISPRAYRPLVAALGGLFTVAVSFSILMLVWHFPSDVVGGYLVATAWGLVALAALTAVNARWPRTGTVRVAAKEAVTRAPTPAAIATVALVFGLGVAIAAATRADQLARFADEHTAMVAVASAVAVSALVLLAAVASISGTTRRSR